MIYLRIVFLFSFAVFAAIFDCWAQESDDYENDSVQFYADLSYRYFYSDSPSHALRSVNSAFEMADLDRDKAVIAKLYGLKGYIYLNHGASIRAIEAFGRTKTLGEELGDETLQIMGCHGLGRVYIVSGNYDLAKQYLERGLEIAERSEALRSQAVLNNALGVLEQSRDSLSVALGYFVTYREYSLKLGDSLSLVYAYINIGDVYSRLEMLDSAAYYLEKAKQVNVNIDNAQAKAAILGNHGMLLYARGEYRKSIAYVGQSLAVSVKNNLSEFTIESYYLLIDNYQAMGDNDSAVVVYKELDAFKDSLRSADDFKKFTGINNQLLLDEKAASVIFWQNKYRDRSIVLFLTIALICVIVVLLVVLLVMLIKKYRKRMYKHDRETHSLNQAIDEKNRELVTRIISENQRDTVLDHLGKSLDMVSKEKDIEKVGDNLAKLKRELASQGQVMTNWSSFKLHFEKVHPDFFDKLKKIQPGLTQNELRMCAYIKMNLATKEIANILNISHRSIQTSRYRLKKKLNLSPKSQLISYIQSI